MPAQLISAVVVVYFSTILVYIAIYFRHSFSSPLPWEGRTNEFYNQQVLMQVEPQGGEFAPDGSILSYVSYPGLALLGEQVGWSAFVWCCVLFCMFGGVASTGKAVYVTMAIRVSFPFQSCPAAYNCFSHRHYLHHSHPSRHLGERWSRSQALFRHLERFAIGRRTNLANSSWTGLLLYRCGFRIL